MNDIHNLYPIIEDILYSNHANIDIVLPYWGMKKRIGPQLAKLLKEVGIARTKSTVEEWFVISDKGPKRINFTTRVHNIGRSNTIIIPNDKE